MNRNDIQMGGEKNTGNGNRNKKEMILVESNKENSLHFHENITKMKINKMITVN